MIVYWALVNYILYIIVSVTALMSLINFMREMLNKRNYILQLPETSAQNLEEIQLQCEDILEKKNKDRIEQTKSNGKPKFQLMQLSKITIKEIQDFIKSISYVKYQIENIFTNYHYLFNFLKSEQKYPKIILQKSGMIFLLFVNLKLILFLRMIFQCYYYSNETSMKLDISILIIITIITLIINLLINKYLVNLEYSHSYYFLFKQLKYKKRMQEQEQKEIEENTIYDRQKFKQYLKPIKLIVQNNEENIENSQLQQQQQQQQQQSDSQQDILFMKVNSMNSIVIEDEDQNMIINLEQQEDYLGQHHFMLSFIGIFLFLLFIQYNYLFVLGYSDYNLLISLAICQVLDFFIRALVCFLIWVIQLIIIKRQKINFPKVISQIQVYEVFEEHIKLGITYLDENYTLEDDEHSQEDYSFVDNLNETNNKSALPIMQQSAKIEEDNENWLIKKAKETMLKVKQDLEKAHLPQAEYDRKYQEQIKLEQQKQKQLEEEDEIRKKTLRQQKQIEEYLAKKEQIDRTANIQNQFINPLDGNIINMEQKQQIINQRNEIQQNKSAEINNLKGKYQESHLKDVILKNKNENQVKEFQLFDTQNNNTQMTNSGKNNQINAFNQIGKLNNQGNNEVISPIKIKKTQEMIQSQDEKQQQSPQKQKQQ